MKRIRIILSLVFIISTFCLGTWYWLDGQARHATAFISLSVVLFVLMLLRDEEDEY